MITHIEPKEIRRLIKGGTIQSPTTSDHTIKSKKFIKDENNDLLIEECYNNWSALSAVRQERERNIRYKNGDQWSDTIEDPEKRGHYIKEEAAITRNGKLPLKHNIVGQIVRNLIGQMLSNPSQSIVFARSDEDISLSEMLTNALNACHQTNNSRKLDIAVAEDLILSGIGCMKVRYGYMHEKNRHDGKLELVNINRLFFNSDVEDPRLTDLSLIGQIHEYSIDEIISSFATSGEEELQLRKILATMPVKNTPISNDLYSNTTTMFYHPTDAKKYRIIEAWSKKGGWVNLIHDPLDGTEQSTHLSREEIEAINKERIASVQKEGGKGDEIPLIEFYQKYEYYWEVKFMTTDGYTLHHSVSPYQHQSHPYTIAAMPMIDGQFRSYISDIIDIQRYINRLIVTIDFIMGSSAKGVLMLPEDCIPDGYSVDDFAQEYVKTNGIIVYRPNNKGNIPQQIVSNSNPAAIWEMLQTQMSLLDQVSGVSDAIQGRTPSSSTTASLYAQQANNSQLNYRILFDTLSSFTKERDEKLTKVLMQYYSEQRLIDITSGLGVDGSYNGRYWNPVEAQKITEFNLVVTQSFDTPTYRMQFEDKLTDMLKGRYIDFEMYLKNSSMPYAKNILAQMETARNSNTTI